ncbi:MAG: hypothetical protein WA150_05595 [Methylovirgula sp.]
MMDDFVFFLAVVSALIFVPAVLVTIDRRANGRELKRSLLSMLLQARAPPLGDVALTGEEFAEVATPEELTAWRSYIAAVKDPTITQSVREELRCRLTSAIIDDLRPRKKLPVGRLEQSTIALNRPLPADDLRSH